jgi:hypothetical protein
VSWLDRWSKYKIEEQANVMEVLEIFEDGLKILF